MDNQTFQLFYLRVSERLNCSIDECLTLSTVSDAPSERYVARYEGKAEAYRHALMLLDLYSEKYLEESNNPYLSASAQLSDVLDREKS